MKTRNAHFFEDVFPYKVAQERSSLEGTSMNQEPSQEEDEPRRTINNLEIHQIDVKPAFLNKDLNEEIYIEQPEGFVTPDHKRKVSKFVKSLYGLKQAPKQWHEKFDKVMIKNGFRINECDKCVYVKGTKKGYVIVCLYVDDMLIIGSNNEFIKTLSLYPGRLFIKRLLTPLRDKYNLKDSESNSRLGSFVVVLHFLL
ncbi:hypothetical protein RJ639_019601 [Escallonia herrerae]|uniref:Reverse transcriptase Ty1/copia-type domain-containing protein n=1 Tax=Escallonia herrerae TaxID=1293975 RepID=A0AA89AJL8_9ASTE|nr:hypothetical protein RJ639_019601 [Escallonia herrerae]